jgi:hypothetical protein
MFNYRIKFKFNYKIYIKIMRYKILRSQKFMCRNIIRLIKSQKSIYNDKQTGMVFKNDLFYLLLLFVSDLF